VPVADPLTETDQWLASLLRDGPMLGSEVQARAKAAGLSKGKLAAAAARLCIIKTELPGATGPIKPKQWTMPE
jgi:hypothetical protein